MCGLRMLTHDVDEQHAGSIAFFLQGTVSVALHWKERIQPAPLLRCGAHVQHVVLGLIQNINMALAHATSLCQAACAHLWPYHNPLHELRMS